MNPKPGYKTSEFWLSLIAQALGFAVILGFVSLNDSRTLEESLGKVVAAVATIAASARTVIAYIKSRTEIKRLGPLPEPPREEARDSFLTPPFLLLVVLGGAGLLACSASAAPVLPWRQQINERLQFQEKLIQQLIAQRGAPAPAPPPIMILPIPGAPRQDLPIEGGPKQPLPIPGDPKFLPPIGGEPKQPLPPGGDPRLELPLAPPGGEPQRLSVQRVLAPVWISVPLKEKR